MTDISSAIKQICEEKGLSYEAVIATIESALAAAYRKDFGQKNQNIKVEYNPENNQSKVFDIKTVVEDLPPEELEELKKEEEPEEENIKKIQKPDKKGQAGEKADKLKKDAAEPAEEAADGEEERKFNQKTDIQLSDALFLKKTAKIGDEIKTKLEVPEEYGRMAAQTAKQVIIQRLREAEREMVFNEFKDKEKEVVSGVVQRREGRIVLVDLGKSVGVIPPDEQIPGEFYRPGERIKVYVKEVGLKPKGPEIILSRISDEILKKVFYLEIPEISNGLIELKAVAREAGHRAKVAVFTDSENVDPIGSCVGQRGARIQTIINELGGEKVDIIQYDEDISKFIMNALSPAKIMSVEINEKEKKAIVSVASDQLSLAIGKGGQNARLAAKLTGWKIDIAEAKTAPAADEAKKEKDNDEKNPPSAEIANEPVDKVKEADADLPVDEPAKDEAADGSTGENEKPEDDDKAKNDDAK